MRHKPELSSSEVQHVRSLIIGAMGAVALTIERSGSGRLPFRLHSTLSSLRQKARASVALALGISVDLLAVVLWQGDANADSFHGTLSRRAFVTASTGAIAGTGAALVPVLANATHPGAASVRRSPRHISGCGHRI
jgi:hypothetical protein